MAVTFHLVPVDEIIVDRDKRQRTKLVVDDLIISLQQNEKALPDTFGLMQPIVLREGYVLVAGERRLEAFRRLSRPMIPCLNIEELGEDEAYILELEENYKRLGLRWQEEVRALERIHKRFVEQDGEWTQERTAARLGITPTKVSQSLSLAEVIETDAEVRNAVVFSTAYAILQRKQGRELDDVATSVGFSLKAALSKSPILAGLSKAASSIVAESVGAVSKAVMRPPSGRAPLGFEQGPAAHAMPEPSAGGSLLCYDFKEWVRDYRGPRFNLIHCDFPYAAGAGKDGSQIHASGDGRTYEDTEEVYYGLCEALVNPGMGTAVGGSAHILCWYQAGKYAETYQWWKDHAKQYGLTVFDVPLIWYKSDGSGVVSDAARRYRHIYESALLISRGDRKIVRTCGDVYAAPISRDLHPSEKPEPMLRHFFRALVSNTTRMLDPTAGSGSSLRAAESLGAEFVFGLEKDKEFHKLAVEELDRFRRKRALEALVKRDSNAEDDKDQKVHSTVPEAGDG